MSGADTSPGIARAVAEIAATLPAVFDRAAVKNKARLAKAGEWLRKRDAFDKVATENARRDPNLAAQARLMADHAAFMSIVWTALIDHRYSEAKQAALHAYRIRRVL